MRHIRRVEAVEVSGLCPGTIVGRCYRLERVIGSGGMGQVWAARHVSLGSSVAIKVLGDEQSSQPLAAYRFAKEARIAAELRSPHVVHVYDSGVAPVPYLAMELLEGETLRERLVREGRLSLSETARFVAEAARALRLAEQRGIVHRDIKPSNLFIARYDEQEVLKVVDFGIAWMREGDPNAPSTSSGAIVGSLPYLSPEQARGGPVDFRSDLWSLAVVAYRSLTGVEPFAASDTSETLRRITLGERHDARTAAPDLPLELDGFFERALALDPRRRFASACELASALTALAGRYGSLPPAQKPPQLSARPVGEGVRTTATQSWKPLRALPAFAPPQKRARQLLFALMVGACALLAWRNADSTIPQPRTSELVPSQVSVGQHLVGPANPALLEGATQPVPSSTIKIAVSSAGRDRAPASPHSRPASVPARPQSAVGSGRRVALDPVFGLPFLTSHEGEDEKLDRTSAAVSAGAAAARSDSAGARARSFGE